MTRSRSIIGGGLFWVLPIVFLFWLYSDGLKTWFMADDFAWLGLIRQAHSFSSTLTALFAPAAQGTIRPWSERGFFLVFESIFGLDSLPFRICVFTTMAADIVLVIWITRQLTGSRVAGFMAAILWTSNTALATVMTWNSAYNEALCPLFLLGAMALFIRFAETGRRSFWWWQLVVFTLGFGALEINVVYPALAAAYVLFAGPSAGSTGSMEKRKRLLLSLFPLFCISIAYYLAHRAVAPIPADGPYALAFDHRMFNSLALYWKWSLLPEAWIAMGCSARLGNAIFWLLTIVLAVFFIRQMTKSRHFLLFFVFWFLITIAPMIPLPDHRTDYYLTIPLIGLAMLGGYGVSRALDASWPWRFAAVLSLVAYLGGMLPVTRFASHWWLERSLSVRGLVLGVEAAHQKHPGKSIVVDGVTSDVYNDTLAHSAFYPLGISDVYLTPSSGDSIQPASNPAKLREVVMDPGALRNAITHDQVVIYSDVGDHLRNVTGVWERSDSNSPLGQRPLDQVPRRVQVGNPLLAYLLGPEWFSVEPPGFRWMPRRATLRLGGPRSANDKLLLEGYCPEQQLKDGVMHVAVSVDGIPLKSTQIGNPETNFRRLFVIPPSLVGRDSVEVAISVDRVTHEPGGRELGLVFGTIAFQ